MPARKKQKPPPRVPSPITRQTRQKALVEACREWSDSAILTIVGVMLDPDARDADRLVAAKEILNRGHGKAPQVISISDGREAQVQLFADIVGAIADMRDVTRPVTIEGTTAPAAIPKKSK